MVIPLGSARAKLDGLKYTVRQYKGRLFISCCSSTVERLLCKQRVASSILVNSSTGVFFWRSNTPQGLCAGPVWDGRTAAVKIGMTGDTKSANLKVLGEDRAAGAQNAFLAQLVEHPAVNRNAVSSSLTGSAIRVRVAFASRSNRPFKFGRNGTCSRKPLNAKSGIGIATGLRSRT